MAYGDVKAVRKLFEELEESHTTWNSLKSSPHDKFRRVKMNCSKQAKQSKVDQN